MRSKTTKRNTTKRNTVEEKQQLLLAGSSGTAAGGKACRAAYRVRGRVPPGIALVGVLVFMLGILYPAPVWSQADRRAEERSRFDLGRLSEGPAIIGGGIVLGEPSGLTAKLWYTESGFAVDTALAWSFQEDANLYMHVNSLFHLAIIETAGGRYLAPFVGGGISYRVGARSRLGLRVPLGLSILPFTNFPVEFFAEIAPGVDLIPDTSPGFGAGIGARFYVPF
jgi:hypothetical protein